MGLGNGYGPILRWVDKSWGLSSAHLRENRLASMESKEMVYMRGMDLVGMKGTD